jgi:hypothetical protein
MMIGIARIVNSPVTQALFTNGGNAELELGGPRGPKLDAICPS